MLWLERVAVFMGNHGLHLMHCLSRTHHLRESVGCGFLPFWGPSLLQHKWLTNGLYRAHARSEGAHEMLERFSIIWALAEHQHNALALRT
ncbi:MAG: hypothetical protein EA398_01665 [Deltaproteobacteria bacterium]|nr:MAG: hypothetical protein EA398_01665 [Deltaproteobacteria bacterium]